ncbi:hypothetical protein [Adhaeretor mobilis]|nr:hypothetical protein [Adhaeretor mobilis]
MKRHELVIPKNRIGKFDRHYNGIAWANPSKVLPRLSSTFLVAALIAVLIGLPRVSGAVFDATLVGDTFISSDATENTTNFSDSAVLKFRTHSSTWRNPLIQFDLPVLPAGEQIVQAELIITSAQDTTGIGGTPDIEVLATTTAIDMATVTYVNSTPSLQTGGEDFTSALLWTGLVGDFDSNGVVEGADFLLWQRNATIGNLSDWEANYASPNSPRVWSDFSTESVIPGEDFTTGQVVTYADTDGAAGMLKFVQDHISGSGTVTVNFGLGFVLREGNDGTSSVGWTIHSSDGSGTAPILRLTTETVPSQSVAFAIPEPIGGLLLALGLMALSAVRIKTN